MKYLIIILKSLTFSLLLTTFVYGQQKFYVGGGIGQSNVEEDNVIFSEDFDEEDFAFKVFGGLRFHKNFAIELAYLDFGEPDDDILGIDSEIDLHAWALYGVGILPLAERFELFAKLGVAYWDAEGKAEFVGITATNHEDGTELAYGLGASYSFTNQIAVRIEYEGIDVDDEINAADIISISGEFRF